MEFLPLLLLPIIVIWAVIAGIGALTMWIVDTIKEHRATRRARVEAELNRAEAELRAAVLQLASEIGANAHETRKALIRESFLASGQLPPK